jgi:hypothetical protein
MASRPAKLALVSIGATLALLTSARAMASECRYDVVVSDAIASELSVTVECEGGLPAAFVMAEGAPAWAGAMTLSDGGVEIEPDGERWLVPPGTRDGTAHYTLALRAMGKASHQYLPVTRVGPSMTAELFSWLAIPEPVDGYKLAIRFETPNGGDVLLALPRSDDRYRVAASDVPYVGAGAFGTFQREAINVPAPTALTRTSDDTTAIDIAILGDPMSADGATLTDWVARSGRAVAEFWGGFPVERALLLLLPVDGRSVAYGRVDATGGTTIIVLVGRDATQANLFQDWVLIHEMLHLGSPYMRDTGAWLNEGIATFYEPIVRMRAGWKTRDEVWQEWIEWMPNGLGAMGEVGLTDAERGGVYWGGALFLLLADIEVRQRTDLALGIEDCLRDIRDVWGAADTDWSSFDFVQLCDATFGGTTVSNLMINHLHPGEPPDLDALWAQLGVSMAEDGTISYDDTAPFAAVRDAILSGGPNAKWQPVPLDTE